MKKEEHYTRLRAVKHGRITGGEAVARSILVLLHDFRADLADCGNPEPACRTWIKTMNIIHDLLDGGIERDAELDFQRNLAACMEESVTEAACNETT